MTGNQGTPDRRLYSDRSQSSRKPSSSGIPPLKVPGQFRRNPEPKISEPKISEQSDAHFPDPWASPPQPQSPQPTDDATSRPEQQPLRSAYTPRSIPPRLPKAPFKMPMLRFPKSWLFWGITSVVAFSGVGIFSALTLFRLPSLPNCPAIFWPTASASLRLYCAQLRAERHNVDDLLKAIALVDSLPEDHALRPEINRNIEEWAEEILNLAEESFHEGDLSGAIKTAKRIPSDTEAYKLVEQRTQEWQSIWANAEGIYREVEDALQQQNLRQAFLIANRLLEVGNRHWETTKYRELNHLITATREDSNKLGEAKALADQGGLSNLLAAIKLVEEVKSSSPLYHKAQLMMVDLGRDMLALAEAVLDQRDYEGAIDVVRQIPDQAGLQAEVKDFKLLAEAQAQAWGGSIDDIEAAIVRAQKIEHDRPLYRRAQELVVYWQLEIQDIQRLAAARQIAQAGTVSDLRAAIAEAQLIPSSNPRGQEAQQAIDQWTATIQTIEDRPYLDRAEQWANRGDVDSLQLAINEANQIGQGRALYDEASERIASWQNQIERIQDQPLLNQARYLASAGNLIAAIDLAEQITAGRALYDEAQADIQSWSSQLQRNQDQPMLDLARQFANQGNLSQAIATAEQISSERVLYEEAQAEIQVWRSQYSGRDRLQQAYNTAELGTPAMLLAAIQIANDIPSDNPSRAEADQVIDRWSWRILEIAQAQAAYDLQGAITTAQSIPAYTEAHSAAQEQIQTWQQQTAPIIRR